VRIAVADGVLRPGDRLLSVRAAATQLGLAANTVGRAYADLAREGVLVTRPGGGTRIAAKDALDRPALAGQRRERIQALARQIAVRALAVGLDPAEVAQAVVHEFGSRRSDAHVARAAGATGWQASDRARKGDRNYLEPLMTAALVALHLVRLYLNRFKYG
jgi:DNA-binding transcriptional regulator YhcF (GntR family)